MLTIELNGLFLIFLGQLTINPSEITRDSVRTLFPGLGPEDVLACRRLSFIGLGSGFSPAADDFLCGDFLARYFIGKEVLQLMDLWISERE